MNLYAQFSVPDWFVFDNVCGSYVMIDIIRKKMRIPKMSRKTVHKGVLYIMSIVPRLRNVAPVNIPNRRPTDRQEMSKPAYSPILIQATIPPIIPAMKPNTFHVVPGVLDIPAPHPKENPNKKAPISNNIVLPPLTIKTDLKPYFT